MKWFFAAVLVALAALILFRGPLAWDGGWILFAILDSRSPVRYADRLANLPLHSVVLIAARLTDNLRVLESVFSLVYAGIPVLGLALSWWTVRRVDRRLFVWPALGIGLATLPGQFNFLSDSIMALNLFWPVYLWILCAAPPFALPVATLLAAAVFFMHPVAMPLFVLGALVAFLLALKRPEVRTRMIVVAGTLAVGAAARLVLFFVTRTPYESAETSLSMQLQHLTTGIARLAVAAEAAVWVAALAVFLRPRLSARPACARVLALTAWAGVSAAGLLLLGWASNPLRWAYSLDFRNLAGLCLSPILTLAAVEVLFPASDTPTAVTYRRRLLTAQAAAVVFCAVLSVQGFTWDRLSTRLRASIAAHRGGCVSVSDLRWPLSTALDHWATPAYAVLLQGRRPDTLILHRGVCGHTDFAHETRFTYVPHVVRHDGWFFLPGGGPKG